MDIKGITGDAVKYPLSDWKKLLILGIIILITGITGVATTLGATNIYLVSILAIFGFIIGFLVNGYMFRIVRSSLNGVAKLPEFKHWIDMGIDGLKVFITFIVYSIPVILIISIFTPVFFDSNTALVWGINPLELLIGSLNSVILPGIWSLTALLYDLSLSSPEGIFAIIMGLVYLIIITPIFLVAIANMAYYDGEFRSAFRFHEIFDEISSIGWIKLTKWYVTTGILFLILFIIITNIIAYIFSLAHLSIGGELLVSLIVAPYFYMFFARSMALYYMPD